VALKTLSAADRAQVWAVINDGFERAVVYPRMGGRSFLNDPWLTIMRNKHIYRDHRMVDDFKNSADELRQELRAPIEKGNYVAFFDLVQWLLRQRMCPPGFAREIDLALRATRAAYRVLDSDTVAPIGSEAEAQTLARAFADLAAAEFSGARQHLRKAAEELTAGPAGTSMAWL
jgi:hypothetical protein